MFKRNRMLEHTCIYFIKVPYINKGIEFIELTNIFREKICVVFSTHADVLHTATAIICAKCNTAICNTIFIVERLVSGLDIGVNTSDS